MTETNLWRERASLNKRIAEKKEEYTSGKVSLAVLNFVEKQTRNLPGSEELAKSFEQQTISIQVMGLKNKVENMTAQLKEEDMNFAIKIARLAGSTHQYDPEEMTKTEEDLDDLITEICDEIRTRFTMTQIKAEEKKALKLKIREERLNKMDEDNHQKPKKSAAPKGNPKGAKNTTKGSKTSGSKNPKNAAKPKKKAPVQKEK
ncbi:hypothetical protein BB561_005882 [Smittium simulii]|uniref:Uncharacterized protein n=1 Tax=Smittium simulii TaxID=133385 RepID=A0A2T9Y7X2_9FUNG|nr:hypothetical protein BB561_005882 [Smittium simulii]